MKTIKEVHLLNLDNHNQYLVVGLCRALTLHYGGYFFFRQDTVSLEWFIFYTEEFDRQLFDWRDQYIGFANGWLFNYSAGKVQDSLFASLTNVVESKLEAVGE